MNSDAAAGDGLLNWKAWTAALVLRRALFREQIAYMNGNRARAVRRAAAAEIIAQEANAARLKVLLEAAREQATAQTIESAERRFAEAKDEWEAAQRPLLQEDNDLASDMAADGVSTRQVALRSATVAGLILAGVFIYLDPEIRGESLLGSRPGADAVPVSVLANASTDIDPVVSASRPLAPLAETAPAVAATVPDRPTIADSAGVRKVSALENDPIPAARTVKIRSDRHTPSVPDTVPYPARNPFYVTPKPPAARTAPEIMGDFE